MRAIERWASLLNRWRPSGGILAFWVCLRIDCVFVADRSQVGRWSRLKRRPRHADSLTKPDPQGDSVNRRSHPRFQTRFDVLCSAGEREGSGTLVNISRSGARLDTSSHMPEPGTKVRLYVFIQPVCPFELSGEVVRCDGTTFAIRYSNLDAEVGRLVDDVAALVMEP